MDRLRRFYCLSMPCFAFRVQAQSLTNVVETVAVSADHDAPGLAMLVRLAPVPQHHPHRALFCAKHRSLGARALSLSLGALSLSLSLSYSPFFVPLFFPLLLLCWHSFRPPLPEAFQELRPFFPSLLSPSEGEVNSLSWGLDSMGWVARTL